MSGPRRASFSARPDAPPRSGVPLGEGGTPYDLAAGPVLDLAGRIEDGEAGAARLLAEARARLDRFERDLVRAAVPAASVPPARLALALVLDRAARDGGAIAPAEWGPGAHRLLFDGEAMSAARLREFVGRARAAGATYDPVARFLAACLARVEEARTRLDPEGRDGFGVLLVSAALGFLLLCAGWAFHAEWAFHREAARAFAAEAVAIGLDRSGEVPDLPARLERMAAAVADLDALVARAPLRLFARPFRFDAAEAAHAGLAAAVARHAPPVLARAIGTALASEGDGLASYDTVRAWDILSGAAGWNAGFLAGWIEARPALLPDLQGLAPHLRLLSPPGEGWGELPPPDPELLAQARAFAAEAPEEDRAWIELARLPAMTALPVWDPSREVPGLAEVALRRSGRSISAPIPGAYTAAGWDLAREAGAGLAVQAARREARRMYGRDLPQVNDAPDRVLARLQIETLAAWRALLADLRIRPLGQRDTGVLVTGHLARRDSPLALLLAATWQEIGGADRSRPQSLQLRIAAEFGPAVQFAEQGGLDRIAAIFAALNAALGARDEDEELRVGRLMGAQDRAASVAALRQAPPLVVQMVEDVLAQTAIAQADPVSNPLTRDWQASVYELCQVVAAGFPFDPEGADADPAEVARLLAPGGAIDRFVRGAAADSLDTSASPWRWKPDARFGGLSPESAVVLQRAMALGAGLFGGSDHLGAEVTLAALAERGKATVSIGGASAAVDAGGEPARLAWPGPAPSEGVTVAFGDGGEGSHAVEPGPWGFLRLMSGLRLRERDEGRRFLIDLRLPGGRIFLEASFASPDNPLSRLDLLDGFSCPAAL